MNYTKVLEKRRIVNKPAEATVSDVVSIHDAAKAILETIEREREREIISRRFGLYDRRETLEQIGELLGITRERVRQLEKAIISRLKSNSENLPHLDDIQAHLTEHLSELGGVSRVAHLAARVGEGDKRDQAHVAFIATLSTKLIVLSENDDYHHSVAIRDQHNLDSLKKHVLELRTTIKEHGKPLTIVELHQKLSHHEPAQLKGLASTSKHLASLKDQWGLVKWPTVNPKNIRDKIYVVLQDNGKPMHFNDIAEAIQTSNFKRKDVTTQAIHNELIKDKRFVLIGRGIYALKEWGFKKGTVSDSITEVLKKAGEPLHRDEIVKRVLKQRQVKETTILLNLQGKPQFKRVAKATYDLADKE